LFPFLRRCLGKRASGVSRNLTAPTLGTVGGNYGNRLRCREKRGLDIGLNRGKRTRTSCPGGGAGRASPRVGGSWRRSTRPPKRPGGPDGRWSPPNRTGTCTGTSPVWRPPELEGTQRPQNVAGGVDTDNNSGRATRKDPEEPGRLRAHPTARTLENACSVTKTDGADARAADEFLLRPPAARNRNTARSFNGIHSVGAGHPIWGRT